MYKLKLFSSKRICKNPLHEKCCKTKHNISWCWKLIFSDIKLSNLWRLEWYFQNQKVIIKVITINILQKWLALQFLLSVKFIRNISWNKKKMEVNKNNQGQFALAKILHDINSSPVLLTPHFTHLSTNSK